MNLGKFALIVFTISILVGMGSVLSYSKEMTGLDVMKLVDSRDDGGDLIQKVHQKHSWHLDSNKNAHGKHTNQTQHGNDIL